MTDRCYWRCLPLQRGSDRQIVGVSVDDDFGVLQTLQLRHVLIERLLTVSAEMIAAFREQHVAGDDPLLLLLHLRDLRLIRSRLRAGLLQFSGLLVVCTLRYTSA